MLCSKFVTPLPAAALHNVASKRCFVPNIILLNRQLWSNHDACTHQVSSCPQHGKPYVNPYVGQTLQLTHHHTTLVPLENFLLSGRHVEPPSDPTTCHSALVKVLQQSSGSNHSSNSSNANGGRGSPSHNPRPVIIVLDEIDRLISRDAQDLYQLFTLPALAGETASRHITSKPHNVWQ